MMKTMRFLALLLAVMVCLPCAGLALGDYISEAMDEYSDLWTVYYESNGPRIEIDAVLGIKA